MGALRIGFLALLIALLAAGCNPAPNTDEAVKAAQRLWDDILRQFDDEDARAAKDGLCATIRLGQGDLYGAASEFGQGAVRARSALADLEEQLEDPDVTDGFLAAACI